MNTVFDPFCECRSVFPEVCREEYLSEVVTTYTLLISLEKAFLNQGKEFAVIQS